MSTVAWLKFELVYALMDSVQYFTATPTSIFYGIRRNYITWILSFLLPTYPSVLSHTISSLFSLTFSPLSKYMYYKCLAWKTGNGKQTTCSNHIQNLLSTRKPRQFLLFYFTFIYLFIWQPTYISKNKIHLNSFFSHFSKIRFVFIVWFFSCLQS